MLSSESQKWPRSTDCSPGPGSGQDGVGGCPAPAGPVPSFHPASKIVSRRAPNPHLGKDPTADSQATTRGGARRRDGGQESLRRREQTMLCFGEPSRPRRPSIRSKWVALPITASASKTSPHRPATRPRLCGPRPAEHSTLHGLRAADDGVQGLLRPVLSSLRAEEPCGVEARSQVSPGVPGRGWGPPRTQSGFS